jgi:hypothetical protein
VVAGVIVLVKEDGGLVCVAVVLAHTVWRWGAVRRASKEEARRALCTGALGLLAFAVVFLAGLALLSFNSHRYAGTQVTSADRLAPAVRALARTLGGNDPVRLSRLLDALPVYLLMSVLMLLPLGPRLFRRLSFLSVATLPLLAVVLVSSTPYRFNMMLSPSLHFQAGVGPRSSSRQSPRGRPRLAAFTLLAVLSWAGQVGMRRAGARSGRGSGPGLDLRAGAVPLGPAEDHYLGTWRPPAVGPRYWRWGRPSALSQAVDRLRPPGIARLRGGVGGGAGTPVPVAGPRSGTSRSRRSATSWLSSPAARRSRAGPDTAATHHGQWKSAR